jgi:hypothetical protein
MVLALQSIGVTGLEVVLTELVELASIGWNRLNRPIEAVRGCGLIDRRQNLNLAVGCVMVWTRFDGPIVGVSPLLQLPEGGSFVGGMGGGERQ